MLGVPSLAMLAPQLVASFIALARRIICPRALRYGPASFQHPIVVSFVVNPGRISNVIKECIHAGSQAVARCSRILPLKRGEIQQTRARLLVCL
jgi:hypothetical protein